jgi:hypothetical protein
MYGSTRFSACAVVASERNREQQACPSVSDPLSLRYLTEFNVMAKCRVDAGSYHG